MLEGSTKGTKKKKYLLVPSVYQLGRGGILGKRRGEGRGAITF